MTTQKKKKSAKQKRVLIGSVVVAVAIVAGSTFAWFSSKDEVTNRLTASANYNVSIVEDFQPPADWLPGQTINKDVAAVNTGNVDAFVRMWLDGHLRLLNEDTNEPDAMSNYGAVFSNKEIKVVNDVNKTKLGLNYSYTDNGEITYYKTLSTDPIDNPNDINHATAANEATNQPAAFSEVQSMQAAGVLVYAPANAKYTWTLEQGADLWVYSGANEEPTYTSLAKGTTVGSVTSTATTKIAGGSTKATAGQNYYGPIDASTFKPETTGLYLFRRNVEPTEDGTANTYEYSGYYFVSKDDNTVSATGLQNKDTYFALHTEQAANNHSDYVVPSTAVTDNSSAEPTLDQVLPVTPTGVKLFTATESVIDDLTWVYDDTNNKFTVSTGTAPKDIKIEIALANIGTGSEAWTAIADNNKGKNTTFYYNNDLEAGDTTRKLVDSVKLADTTQLGAYLAFDFDLDVFLDSIQVTLDEEGNENALTVSQTGGWATSGLTNDSAAHNILAAKGTPTVTSGEIDSINWTFQNS